MVALLKCGDVMLLCCLCLTAFISSTFKEACLHIQRLANWHPNTVGDYHRIITNTNTFNTLGMGRHMFVSRLCCLCYTGSPAQRPVITWNNIKLFSIETLTIKCREVGIKFCKSSFNKMHFKMLSAGCRHQGCRLSQLRSLIHPFMKIFDLRIPIRFSVTFIPGGCHHSGCAVTPVEYESGI